MRVTKVVGQNILRMMVTRSALYDHNRGKAVFGRFRLGGTRWVIEIYLADDVFGEPRRSRPLAKLAAQPESYLGR